MGRETEMRTTQSSNVAAMARTRELSKAISMRLAPEDTNALNEVCERIPMPRLTVARIALRLGLAALMKDPAKVFAQEARPPTKATIQSWRVRVKKTAKRR